MDEQYYGQPRAAAPYWTGMRIAALVTALVLLVTGVLGTVFQVSAVERFPVGSAAGADPLSPGLDVPGTEPDDPDPATEQETVAARTAAALQAYLELLTEKREAIEGYYWQKGYYNYGAMDEETRPRPVAILDICGDEVPELIYADVDLTAQYVYTSFLHVLTWDGALRTLFEESWDVMAGGGFRYYLYQISGSKDLYACTSFGDESWTVRSDRFIESGGNLIREPVLREESRPQYVDGEYNYVKTFLIGEAEVDEEAYNDALAALQKNISAIVMSSKYVDDYAAEFLNAHGELGLTVSDALFELVEKTLPKRGETELDPEAMPDELISFLLQFVGWYSDGDGGIVYREGALSTDGIHLLNSIIHNGSCARFSLYPGEGQTDYWGEADPRGWNAESGGYGSYAAYDAESVDWIAVNIFHLSPAELPLLISQAESAHLFYRQKAENGKDYYYRVIGGVGDPFLKVIPFRVTWEDGKYTVVYDVYFDTEWESRYPSSSGEYEYTACAVMGYEEIDGKQYWTLWSNTLDLPDEPEPEPAPDLFARIPVSYVFTSGMGGWGTQLVISDDGSFQGNFQDSNLGESGDGYDGTVYYSNFRGRFENPRKINDYTYAFDLAELVTLEDQGAQEIVTFDSSRIRYVAAGPYGMDDGKTFYLYIPDALSYRLPESFRWWYYAGYGDNSSGKLGGWGIYNENGAYGFRATGAPSTFETWSQAFEDFVLNQRFYSTGDLALGYGNVNPSYNDTPPLFALLDEDGDGTPELAVFNGRDGEKAADYLFVFRNHAVRYAERRDAGSLAVEGLTYSEVQEMGWQNFLAAWYGGKGAAVRDIPVTLADGSEESLSWGWELFAGDPANYDGALAQAGAALCMDKTAAEELLAKLGFADVQTVTAERFCPVTFGSRRLLRNGEAQLIVAMIAGETKVSSVYDLAALLPEIEALTGGPSERMAISLSEYLSALGTSLDAEGLRLYLAGYSLGGAALSRTLLRLEQKLAAGSRVFAYTYAVPGWSEQTDRSDLYDCIHNLVLAGDLTAQLPFGLTRKGQDHYLESDDEDPEERHALETLFERLQKGAVKSPSEITADYQRITAERPGKLTVLDETETVLAEAGDGTVECSADAPLLILPAGDGFTICAWEGAVFTVMMTGEDGKETSLLRQRVDPVPGKIEELAECRSLRLSGGSAWCVPVNSEPEPERVLFEVDETGRTLNRVSAEGTVSRAVFYDNTLGIVFVGLAALGLLLLLLALLIPRRQR